MSNQIKIAICAALLIVAAAGGWFAYSVYGPKPSIEDVLPSGAVVYTRLAHPAKHWQEGADSEFWKNLASIDVLDVLTRNKVPQEKIAQFAHIQKVTAEFFKNPLIQKFLEKELALALYSDRQAVMVLRLAPSVQAAEFFSRLSDQWGDDVAVTENKYSGQSIVHVRLKKKNTRIKYVRLKDLLFIAQEEDKSINAIIDTYQHRRPALKQDAGFVLVQSRAYPAAEGILYIEKEGLGKMMNADPTGALLKTAGITTYGVSYLPGEVAKYKFIAGYKDAQSLAPSMRWLASCVQNENTSLGLVPFDSLIYHWFGCYDFSDLWLQAQEHMHEMPGDKYGGLEKTLNKKGYADLIPSLGNEAGFYLTDVDTQGMFPYPRFSMFVKIKDQAKAEESLKKIFKSPLGLIQEEEYNQVRIRFMSLPLGANMDPGYCFLGDYVLVASSRQLLKKSIDTFHDPTRSIKSDQAFTDIGLGAPGKTQSIMFLKVGDIAHRLRELLDWGNKYLSSQVSMISVYKQESQNKKKELGEGLAVKETELKAAQDKLHGLQARLKKAESAEDQAAVAGLLEDARRQVRSITTSIKTYKAQQVELANIMARYDDQSDNAKLFMFNSQNVLVPILRSLETINVQGMRMVASDHLVETEWMMK